MTEEQQAIETFNLFRQTLHGGVSGRDRMFVNKADKADIKDCLIKAKASNVRIVTLACLPPRYVIYANRNCDIWNLIRLGRGGSNDSGDSDRRGTGHRQEQPSAPSG